MKKTILVVGFILVIFALNINVFAQSRIELNPTPASFIQFVNSPRTPLAVSNEEYYNDFPTNKMGLGVINAATSWTDIPIEIAETSAKDNLLSGITFGFVKGLASGFTRGAAGVVDVATFGLPPYQKPLMEPEYEVKRPEEGFKIDILRW